MSYGRAPYHIIGTKGWHGDVIQFMDPKGTIERGEFQYQTLDKEGKGGFVNVPDEAMAQFIAHLAMRGSKTLQQWIDLGLSLEDDPTGFYKNHPVQDVVEEYYNDHKEMDNFIIIIPKFKVWPYRFKRYLGDKWFLIKDRMKL